MSTFLLIIYATHWIAAILALGVAIYGLRFRHRPMALRMSIFSALVGFWPLCSAIIFALPDLAQKILINRIKFISPILIPLSLLSIVLSMIPKKPWHKWIWLPAMIIPLISLGITFSNTHHELLINNYHLLYFDELVVLAFGNGPWFRVHASFTSAIVFLNVFLLILLGQKVSMNHRKRIWILVIAILVPALGDSIAVYFAPTLRYLQITPLLSLFTIGMLIYAIVGRHFIDVVPFARSQILDSLGDIYLIFNDKDLLVDFNQLAKKILGLNKKQIGRNEQELSLSHPAMAGLLALKSDQNAEWHFYDRTYEVNQHNLFTTETSHLGFVLVCKDISVRKAQERSLTELSDLKTKLLAVMGHDFQGNLAATLFITQNLVRNIPSMPPEDIIEACLNLEKTAVQNIAMVEELLLWSKARLGAKEIRTHVHLKTLVKNTCDFMQPLLNEGQVRIDLDLDQATSVTTDASALGIILRNLLSNAIKASPQGERIVLSLQNSNSALRLSIQDFGPGIDNKLISEIFQLNKGQNTGIGLFLCQDFVSKLGGKIWVECLPNQGSCFYVNIPLETRSMT